MPEPKRTVRTVTNDEALVATTRGAVAALDGWEISEPQSVEELLARKCSPQDVILLDAWLRSENVYESCRRLTGKTRCRTYVVTDGRNGFAVEVAAFCGATGTCRSSNSGRKKTGAAPAGGHQVPPPGAFFPGCGASRRRTPAGICPGSSISPPVSSASRLSKAKLGLSSRYSFG